MSLPGAPTGSGPGAPPRGQSDPSQEWTLATDEQCLSQGRRAARGSPPGERAKPINKHGLGSPLGEGSQELGSHTFANRPSFSGVDGRIGRSELDGQQVTGEADCGEQHYSTTQRRVPGCTLAGRAWLYTTAAAGLTTRLCTAQQASLISLEMGGWRQFYLGPQVSNKIRQNEPLHV